MASRPSLPHPTLPCKPLSRASHCAQRLSVCCAIVLLHSLTLVKCIFYRADLERRPRACRCGVFGEGNFLLAAGVVCCVRFTVHVTIDTAEFSSMKCSNVYLQQYAEASEMPSQMSAMNGCGEARHCTHRLDLTLLAAFRPPPQAQLTPPPCYGRRLTMRNRSGLYLAEQDKFRKYHICNNKLYVLNAILNVKSAPLKAMVSSCRRDGLHAQGEAFYDHQRTPEGHVTAGQERVMRARCLNTGLLSSQ